MKTEDPDKTAAVAAATQPFTRTLAKSIKIEDPDKTAAVAAAAVWLAENWHVAPQPFTRTLRHQFGLMFNEAVKVMATAGVRPQMLSDEYDFWDDEHERRVRSALKVAFEVDFSEIGDPRRWHIGQQLWFDLAFNIDPCRVFSGRYADLARAQGCSEPEVRRWLDIFADNRMATALYRSDDRLMLQLNVP